MEIQQAARFFEKKPVFDKSVFRKKRFWKNIVFQVCVSEIPYKKILSYVFVFYTIHDVNIKFDYLIYGLIYCLNYFYLFGFSKHAMCLNCCAR